MNEEVAVSASDVEAAAEFDLRSLGIDPMNTPIEDLLKIYREQAGICSDYTRKQKDGTTDPSSVEGVIKAELKAKLAPTASDEVKTQVQTLRTIGTNVTEAWFNKTPATVSLLSSAVLLEELRNLVSLMEDEYNYHYQAAVQAEKDAKGIKSTPNETAIRAKLACLKLKGAKPGEGLINARINMAKAMGMEAEIPSDLYKTDGVRQGFNTEVFPRLPRLDIEGTVSNNSTHLVFRWMPVSAIAKLPGDGALGTGTIANEADMINCTETTLNDVAHNVVSSGAYRITGKDLERKLKSAGHGIGATDTEWSIELKTGTLFGKKA